MKRLILFSALIILFSSCGRTIHYLGDFYTPKDEVEVFYDTNDVPYEFKVIGQMTHDKFINYNLETIKTEMIKKASLNGADAIVFQDFFVTRENEADGDRFSVVAKAIRYTK